MSSILLRPYQQEAIDAVWDNARQGVQRQLIELPTGTGKTIVFAHLVSDVVANHGRALVLAHRDELVNQAATKMASVDSRIEIGIVKGPLNELGRHLTIASVQTVSRKKRLDQLTASGTFDMVIVDEAHHVEADSYQRVIEACMGPASILVGVTATPFRGDGRGLDKTFQEAVYRKNLIEMIKAGYLCDLRCIQVQLAADFNKLHILRGDFSESELAEMMETANAPHVVATSWREHAADRKGIAFSPTIALAERFAEALRDEGFRAASLSGQTPSDERRRILRDLSTGQLQIVTNCAVLTEGFDEPSIECVLMGRPTRSKGLYLQCIGRGTRLHPDKTECLILDLVGTATRYDLSTFAKLTGSEEAAKQGYSVLEIERGEYPPEEPEPLEVEGDIVYREVDLFGEAKADKWIDVTSGSWKDKPITDKQRRMLYGLLKELRGSANWHKIGSLKSGQASEFIDQMVTEKAERDLVSA